MARIRQPSPPPSMLVLGRYRLEEAIGSGAYGTVWRALDERLDRVVAVKAIPADFAGERADREIRAAARLSHPAVVTLHEAASDPTHTYLVSEFVRGETLQRLYADGRVSDRDVARIGAALAAAVDHAHSLGVVHRDIKPGNVLIPDAPRSEAGIAKLADFGIARLAGDSSLTGTGDVVGTLAYMSPEQAAGEEVDEMTDLWSLAVVIHEGFTGRNPMRGRTPAETARNLASPDPELLGDVRPDLPAELTDMLETALETDPCDRCTVSELGSELAAALAKLDDEPGTLAPAVRRGDRRLPKRRHDPRVVRIPGGDLPEIDETAPTARRTPPAPLPLSPRPPEQAVEPVGPAVHHHLHLGSETPRREFARRLVGALSASVAAALWVSQLAPSSLHHQLLMIAGITALAVFLLPRLGWMAALCAAMVAMASAGKSGEAVVLAAALLPCVPLMWRAPEWWSLPTLGPLLGAPGFGGAWPAFASLASSAWLRAAAGMVGAWQVACAEILLGRTLVAGPPARAVSSSGWAGDPSAAVRDGLIPLFSGSLPRVAIVWAVAAVLLPLCVAGRTALADALGGAAWAAAVAAATALLTDGAAGGVLAGALAGAAFVVGWKGCFPVAPGSAGAAGRPPTMGPRFGRVK